MKPQCIQAVEAAIGRKLKTNESADINANIKRSMVDLARQDIDRWRNLSEYEKTLEASQHVGKMLEGEVKRKNKIAAMDIIALNKAMDKVLNHKKLSSMESLDRMIAFHGDMSGIQSVSKNAESIASLQQGRLHDLYSKVDGSLGLIQDKKYVRDFVKEAFGEDSGNPSAKKNAADFADVTADLKDRFNRNGGNIRTLEGWGMWTAWSPGRALEKGLDKWLELGLKNFDRSKAVHEDGRAFSEDELIDLLTASYKTIKSEGANKMEVGKANYSGNSKVTNRHAESRVLHWKDADAWLEMQSEFGDMPLIDIIDSNINRMAKEIALVEMFGSNPRENYKILKDAAAKKDKDERNIPSGKVDETASRIDDMFDDFTGSNIGSEFWANVGLAYRSVNTGAMLGGTTLSSATDQAMIAKTAHIHGLSYWKTFGEMISQLNPKNKEDREFGYYLGIGVSELTGSISRWSDDGLSSVHGRAAKISRGANNIANQVLRLSGLQALTRASKVAFDTMLMAKYGDMTRNKSWNDLHANDKELLEGTGLSERAWQVMQLAEPHVDRKGRKLMSARAIYAIPDDKLLAAMDGDVNRVVGEIDAQIKELNDRNALDDQRIMNREQKIDDVKRQLSQRLLDYANRKDAQAQVEKQELQDRIDLIDAQKEAVAAQSDINKYLQTEKQANRIQDFLQQVEDGRHSDKVSESTRSNVERNARQYGNQAESLGYRLGNAERRITELRAKMRKANSGSNKAINQKFKELDKRVNDLDAEFADYQSKVAERQAKREHVVNRLANSIDGEKKLLAQKIRDEVATQFQTHLLDEQGMAVIEAGLREKTKFTGGTKRGTLAGEFVRLTTQFKSFPLAFLMRHGSRTMTQQGVKGKAAYAIPLVAMTTILGGLVVQLKELANGNDPSEMWDGEKWYTAGIDSDFLKRSFVAGGGLPILGDILIAGTDTSGRDATDFLGGPFGSDFKTLLNLTVGNATQAANGIDTNAGNEAFKFLKGKIPAQNLFYTKAATNRMIFDEMQDIVAPGYREKLLRKAEREHDRTRWLGDDIGDIQAPDFERVVQ